MRELALTLKHEFPGGLAGPAAALIVRAPRVCWAVVEWSDGDVRRWCQTMRYPKGWVVDAHDGTPDDFAKRVFRGGPGFLRTAP